MPSSNKKKYGSGWAETEMFQDLECPSGTWCQVRKPNPKNLMSLGFLDKFDQLTGIVESKHVKRVKGQAPVVNVKSMSQDPKAIMDILIVADRIVEHVVSQPTIVRPVKVVGTNDKGDPIEEPLRAEEREDGVVYTDMIDDVDKMYIFQHAVGGSTDLATFREQIGQSAESVGDGVEVPSKAVGIPGDGK